MKYLFQIVIFGGIACGFIFPQLQACKRVVPWMVGCVVFLNFFEMRLSWQRFFRRELLVTGSLSALFMPLLVYHVLSHGLHAGLRIGLLLTAMAPSGIIMLAVSRFIPYKDYDLILGNFLFTTFGSILYIPFMIKWLVGTTVRIEVAPLFLQIASLVLIPYGLSEILKRLPSGRATRIIKRYTQAAILVMVFGSLAISISAATGEMVWDQTLLRLGFVVLSIYFLQGGMAYLAGFMLWDKSIRNTLAMIASSRNNNFALGIAIMNFPPLAVVPCVFGIIFHHTTNAFWVWLFRE